MAYSSVNLLSGWHFVQTADLKLDPLIYDSITSGIVKPDNSFVPCMSWCPHSGQHLKLMGSNTKTYNYCIDNTVTQFKNKLRQLSTESVYEHILLSLSEDNHRVSVEKLAGIAPSHMSLERKRRI